MSAHSTVAPRPRHSILDSSLHPTNRPRLFGDTDTTLAPYPAHLDEQARYRAPKRARNPMSYTKLPSHEEFDIYDDHGAHVAGRPSLPSRRESILAHPAQRISRRRDSILAAPAKRRVSGIMGSSIIDLSATTNKSHFSDSPNVCEGRDAKRFRSADTQKMSRRRNIYVPPEDTTILTIHTGQAAGHRKPRLKSPDFGLDLVTLSEEDTELNLKSAIKHSKGQSQRLKMPPKRPLNASRQISGSNVLNIDVAGPPTGKENIPPGKSKVDGNRRRFSVLQENSNTQSPGLRRSLVAIKPRRLSTLPRQRSTTDHHDCLRPTSSNIRTVHWTSTSDASSGKAATDRSKGLRNSPLRKCNITSADSLSPFHVTKSPPEALRRHKSISSQPKNGVAFEPAISGQAKEQRQKYSLLREDLSRPEMYEDRWLDHQEAALTQLINSVFASVAKSSSNGNLEDLRRAFLTLHQDQTNMMLYKRLQASLACGALKVPKNFDQSSLKTDVGQRKKFVALFVDTYQLTNLAVALEVVTGRVIPTHSSSPGASNSPCGDEIRYRRQRRVLEKFILAMLVENEDAVHPDIATRTISGIARSRDAQDDEAGSPAWSWRRTMLRSLMVILLLDRARSMNLTSSCLFQSNSPFKSSNSVLQNLGRLLLQSVGDITKPLGHLNYYVKHSQGPLEEYQYCIKNVATDLRDGVLLTRLVELLAYTSDAATLTKGTTITTVLPNGQLFSSDILKHKDGFLSQHLKLPCIGQASKVHNVQLAISGMQGAQDIHVNASSNIIAEDIVNGHREKTLSLLWSLIGRWGMNKIVNWTELRQEIERLHKTRKSEGRLTRHRLQDMECCKQALYDWAFLIASGRNLRMSNLTTSFADGKIFESIVDEYLPVCSEPSNRVNRDGKDGLVFANDLNCTLSTKLISVGCSKNFVSLFASSSGPSFIPSSDFTLTTLAFFASRFLPLQASYRAATIIQRAYRLHLGRREVTKRIVLMKLAHHCVTVVKTREMVVGAAITIQRAWRAVLDNRIQGLVQDITQLQSIIRGWRTRNTVDKIKKRGRKQLRVKGGW